MRRPMPSGAPIDARRYRRWISRFGSYRAGITNVTVESWLEQFDAEDHDLAARILDAAKVDPMKKVSDLGEDEVNRIRQVIEAEGSVEGDLRKDVSMNIKRLIEIGSYRGYRHRRNLPVRGQRTHTNARTRKGPRKGTVAQKKKATAKT